MAAGSGFQFFATGDFHEFWFSKNRQFSAWQALPPC
jgi:hypothetical protein